MKIPILAGASNDISKFDFTPYQIKILDIESNEFKNYITKLNPDAIDYNLRFVNEIIEDNKHKSTKNFAIVHFDSTDAFQLSRIYDVWKFLLILFPSDLNVLYELHVNTEDEYYQISSYITYEERSTGEYPGEPLFFMDSFLPDINKFILDYFCNLSDNGYLRLATESYTTSYYSSHTQHQYLQLMMSLESILDGSIELSFRLRRSIAVLLGDDIDSCRVIFDNLNKLYELRSKIIHGENFNYEAINTYLPCLKAIVSKVIMELLIHNVPTRKDLNSIINELGYGSKSKISNNWCEYNFNPIIDIEAKLKKLEKVKPAGNTQ